MKTNYFLVKITHDGSTPSYHLKEDIRCNFDDRDEIRSISVKGVRKPKGKQSEAQETGK